MESPHVFQASSDAKPPIPDPAFNRRCSLMASDVSLPAVLLCCCCVAVVLLLFSCVMQIGRKEGDVLQDVSTQDQ